MPDGPIFDGRRIGDPVEPCRATAASAKGWDLPCLLKILCKGDKAVVDQLSKNINLYKVDRVYFEDNLFDGKQWTISVFDAGGTQGGKDITFRSDDSCDDAATTLYHETWHSKQKGMAWPHPAEDDAYYNTELWTIANGLPGQGGLRTKDAKGKVVPDDRAIAKLVDDKYPVQPPAPPGWRRSTFDKAKKQTLWTNTGTKQTLWKASTKGETFPGPELTEGKQRIAADTLKCP